MNGRRRYLILYLGLANGITWLLWIPAMVVADRAGYLLPVIDNLPTLLHRGFDNRQHLLVALSFSLAVYGPLIGALVTVRLADGQLGVTKLWAQMTAWRVGLRWYLIAIGIAVAIAVVPVALSLLLGSATMDRARPMAAIPALLPLFLFQLLTSGLGEEPGWRGFLLPRQQARFSGTRAVWANGLIWAIWHYPITTYSTLAPLTSTPPTVMVVTVLAALAGNTMSLIGMAYLYAWLVNETQSVFLAMVFHASTNVASALAIPMVGPQLFLLIPIMPWVVVLVLEKMLGKTQFPGGDAADAEQQT